MIVWPKIQMTQKLHEKLAKFMHAPPDKMLYPLSTFMQRELKLELLLQVLAAVLSTLPDFTPQWPNATKFLFWYDDDNNIRLHIQKPCFKETKKLQLTNAGRFVEWVHQNYIYVPDDDILDQLADINNTFRSISDKDKIHKLRTLAQTVQAACKQQHMDDIERVLQGIVVI